MGSQLFNYSASGCTQYDGLGFGTVFGRDLDMTKISGIFSEYSASATIAMVSDGTSNTILMGELRPDCTNHASRGWMFEDFAWMTTVAPINIPSCVGDPCGIGGAYTYQAGFKSEHVGGAHFLLADGAVRFISENVDWNTYQSLGGRNDKKVVGEF
ncbi:MAG: DUF1559 domain-containing protein [Planctomycetaceae bacterium]|nr:DUF1559 domain-containing protein [Planctomycetaceae bacterium]